MERGVPKGSFDGGKADELKEVFKTFVHGLSVRVNVFIDPLWLQSLQSANPTVLLEFSLLHSLQPCLQDEDFHIFLWIMFSPMEVGRQLSVLASACSRSDAWTSDLVAFRLCVLCTAHYISCNGLHISGCENHRIQNA